MRCNAKINAARLAAAEKRRALLQAEKGLGAEKRAEMLAASGALRTVDGAGLSDKNRLLVSIQAAAQGLAPSLVGGFAQWDKNGRYVRSGARGLLICFPMRRGDDDGETGDGEADDGDGVRFGWAYVFDISQTCRKGEPEAAAATAEESGPAADAAEPETAAEPATAATAEPEAAAAEPAAVESAATAAVAEPEPAATAAGSEPAAADDDLAAVFAAIAAAH